MRKPDRVSGPFSPATVAGSMARVKPSLADSFSRSKPTIASIELDVEVCAAHVHAVPEPPSKHAPVSVSSELDALVVRCLEKDPDGRPTARDLGEQPGRDEQEI